jgi:hypothetical protein
MPTIDSHLFIARFLNTTTTGFSLDAFDELLDFPSSRLV